MISTIGNNIRQARLEKKLTQTALAELLGVSPQAVSRWESGAAAPDIGLLPDLAKQLGVSADEILGIPRRGREPDAMKFFRRLEEESRKRPFDSAKIREMIGKIRKSYLNSNCISLFWTETDVGCFSSMEVLPEVRKTAEAMLQANPPSWMKELILRRMVVLEDESRARALIDSNSGAITAADGLYESRYAARRDWCRYEPFRQKRLYTIFDRLFREPLTWSTPDSPLDAEVSLRLWECNLAYLHGLCGESPGDEHPISGDGTLDCLVHYRLPLGFAYSRLLAAAGRGEKAITVLADTVGLLERLAQVNEARPLPSRSPFLDRLYEICAVGLTRNSNNKPSEKHIRIFHQDRYFFTVYDDIYPSQYLQRLEEAEDAYSLPGKDPRFVDCLTRLRTLAAACAEK